MVWLPDGAKILKIRLFVLTEFTNVTDRQTGRMDRLSMTACRRRLQPGYRQQSGVRPVHGRHRIICTSLLHMTYDIYLFATCFQPLGHMLRRLGLHSVTRRQVCSTNDISVT